MKKFKNKVSNAIWELYTIAYKESAPSADFEKLYEEAPLNEEGQKVIAYDDYYLHRDRFEKLIEEVGSRYKFSEWEEHSFRFNAYLGAGPTSREPLKEEEEE